MRRKPVAARHCSRGRLIPQVPLLQLLPVNHIGWQEPLRKPTSVKRLVPSIGEHAARSTLITTVVAALGVAVVFGALANLLRVPPLVGYLLAGGLIGPATPGYLADTELAPELAEIGVILLMFGVGLHFSLKDLLSVRATAIPGAIGQTAIATLMGLGLAWRLGWSVEAGLVFGLALSVAST